jgi:hypothetical protein
MFVSGNLIGGLGNQLFILSMAIEYGKKYNRKVVFTQLYSNPHCPNDKAINDFFVGIPLIKESVFKTIRRIDGPVHEYVDLPDATEQLVILNGYYQHKKYMGNANDDIWQQFRSQLPVPVLDVNLTDICFLHVRRTDYVGNSAFEFNSTNYYRKAIQHITCPIILLSDDMEWSSVEIPKLFPDKTWIIPSTNMTATESLYVMSQCGKGAICANSTLSWWGAWLNQNRYITMPDTWTGYCCGDQLYFDGVTVISRD